MKLSLDMKTSLTQTLTPQQIQYLKLLQLPLVQLEQQVMQEIEQNPMLESNDPELSSADDISVEDMFDSGSDKEEYSSFGKTDDEPVKSNLDEEKDPFEFYKMVWQDESDFGGRGKSTISDDEDSEPYQIKDSVSFIDDLIYQLRLHNLTEEEFYLGEQIIGNIDNDGYLRRDLYEIVEETNGHFAEINYEAQQRVKQMRAGNGNGGNDIYENPARQYAISDQVLDMVNNNGYGSSEDVIIDEAVDEKIDENEALIADTINYLKPVTLDTAEKILQTIQSLDPPGIGSRNVRECLLAQCHAIPKPNAAQKLAIEILENTYEAFSMKHYHTIIKQLEVTEDYLKEALDFIRTLNPKPGGGDYQSEINTVIPDFLIYRDEETNELMITVNDSRIPSLKLSTAYEKIKKEAKYKMFNKETREWIRNKYDDAKFLIQAIRQRKSTMLKVMTAIAGLQRGFFEKGADGLRPLIYKDVAEKTGLDISTVCRIVNGKYVQTEFGTYELKFFFSESLPSEDGEEISTTVIKNIIRDIIDKENKKKPLSDDKIAKDLKDKGYNVARRTVAKYREQLKIPVARLRKEL